LDSAQTGNFYQSGDAADQVQYRVARDVAILSLVFCALATALMIVAGSINYLWLLLSIVVLWAILKIVITMRRQTSQAQFVRKKDQITQDQGNFLTVASQWYIACLAIAHRTTKSDHLESMHPSPAERGARCWNRNELNLRTALQVRY
jgi:Ca2+/Na+ antiporter